MPDTIHLGYELGTGKAISIPVGHMVVCGMTQQSGKTTTLEALISRSNRKAVAFVTKRAEGSLHGGRQAASGLLTCRRRLKSAIRSTTST